MKFANDFLLKENAKFGVLFLPLLYNSHQLLQFTISY